MEATQTDQTALRVIRNDKDESWMDRLASNGDVLLFENIVSREFGIDPEMLFSKTRIREVVDARKAYYYFMRRMFRYSYEAVGRISGQNHATVLHGVRGAESLSETDYGFRQRMLRVSLSLQDTIVKIPTDPALKVNGHNLVYGGKEIIHSSWLEK